MVMKEALLGMSVNVTAEIGSMVLNFSDVINFEPGTILNLNKSVTDELVVKVENSPKFKGVPGVSRGNQAIKLTKVIEW